MFEPLLVNNVKTSNITIDTFDINGSEYYVTVAKNGTLPYDITLSTLVKGRNVQTVTVINGVNTPEHNVLTNDSQKFALINTNSNWRSRFGRILEFETFAEGTTEITSMVGTSETGTHTFWSHTLAWGAAAANPESTIGFWTQPNNLGDCGGNGMAGFNRICPYFTHNGAEINHAHMGAIYLLHELTNSVKAHYPNRRKLASLPLVL